MSGLGPRAIKRPDVICAKCGTVVWSLDFGSVNRRPAMFAQPCGHRIRETPK